MGRQRVNVRWFTRLLSLPETARLRWSTLGRVMDQLLLKPDRRFKEATFDRIAA